MIEILLNISVNRNRKKLIVSSKMGKILTVSRKSHHHLETLRGEHVLILCILPTTV